MTGDQGRVTAGSSALHGSSVSIVPKVGCQDLVCNSSRHHRVALPLALPPSFPPRNDRQGTKKTYHNNGSSGIGSGTAGCLMRTEGSDEVEVVVDDRGWRRGGVAMGFHLFRSPRRFSVHSLIKRLMLTCASIMHNDN